MEKLFKEYFYHNWQRKIVALIAAIVLWIFINHSITTQKIVTNVPIRIINLPADKTIHGMLPNGTLSKRIALTLSGTKDVVEELEPGDLEVVIDASIYPDEWIVQLTKKNLVSLNPSINLARHISSVFHSEFILKTSQLITAKVPLFISTKGHAPEGYEFLDIWPKQLLHTVTGPENEVRNLQLSGIDLVFDLTEISKADLDSLKQGQGQGQPGHNHHVQSSQKNTKNGNSHPLSTDLNLNKNVSNNEKNSKGGLVQDFNAQGIENEVHYYISPDKKQVQLSFNHNIPEEINDPEAQHLRIDFIRLQLQPIKSQIPINLFFPSNISSGLNPETISLAINNVVKKEHGINLLTVPLYAFGVSQRFLHIVENYLEVTVTPAPLTIKDHSADNYAWNWSVTFIDENNLETAYVESIMQKEGIKPIEMDFKRVEYLRARFRDYLHRFELQTADGIKLVLKCRQEGNQVYVER